MINDSLGHVAGDELLTATAQRLKKNLRTADTVARLGGDEFAILLDGVESNSAVLHVAERLQEDLIQPHYIGGQEVFTTASIGITLSSTGYESADAILRDADTQCIGPSKMERHVTSFLTERCMPMRWRYCDYKASSGARLIAKS